MMKRAILGLVLASSLFGCASSQESSSGQTTTPSDDDGHMGAMCPMRVAGTTVVATDIEGGVALDFTNATETRELRERVAHMVTMHNQHHASGDDSHGCMMMPASTASAVEIDGGARLSLHAADPAQVDALRQSAHTHAEAMARGECPMRHDDGSDDHAHHP